MVVLASVAFFFFGRRVGQNAERAAQSVAKATAEQTAKRIVSEAEREAESLRKSALISGKEELIKLREDWEVEARRRREEVEREEKRVQDREAVLDRKFDVLEQREKEVGRRGSELGRKEKAIAEREQELDKLIGEERRRLESLAGMSAEQAKSELIHRLEAEAEADAANRIREIRETARRTGHLRLLVRGNGHVDGVVHVRDSLHAPEVSAGELMRPALTVEAVVPVYEALRTMRETRNHLATVTDGGQVVGLITISDVLQRLLVR